MNAKDVVSEYYKMPGFATEAVDALIHDDLVLQWYSSKGYLELDKEDYRALISEMEKSYADSHLEISHIIAEGQCVTVRYTHYVSTIENPAEDMVLAHFVVIWEVKDDKLYKGYLMSQLG
jgi:hypothetical protein